MILCLFASLGCLKVVKHFFLHFPDIQILEIFKVLEIFRIIKKKFLEY